MDNEHEEIRIKTEIKRILLTRMIVGTKPEEQDDFYDLIDELYTFLIRNKSYPQV